MLAFLFKFIDKYIKVWYYINRVKVKKEKGFFQMMELYIALVFASKNNSENTMMTYIDGEENELTMCLDDLVALLPNDNGFTSHLVKADINELIIYSSFIHVDKDGTVLGCSSFKVIVTPSLMYNLNITIDEHNVMKDYFNDKFKAFVINTFYLALKRDVVG
jgi:hypothetical protein